MTLNDEQTRKLLDALNHVIEDLEAIDRRLERVVSDSDRRADVYLPLRRAWIVPYGRRYRF